jgi:type VI protein secretion system component VasK
MDKTSSIVTGGATLTAASLVPAVQWVSGGFHLPMPLEVQLLISGAIVTVIHAARNWRVARAARAAKTATAPAVQS